MIKLAINYKDFDGKEVTEDHYFHLSKAELMDLETGDGESLSSKIERVSEDGDGGQILKMFRYIIEMAYGQRVDGSASEFYKDPDLTKRFLGGLAFDQMLEDLLLNTTDAIKFINGIMPSGLSELAAKIDLESREGLNKLAKESGLPPVPLTDLRSRVNQQLEADGHKLSGLGSPMDGESFLPWAFRDPTEKELMAMGKAQLLDAMRRKNSGWHPPAENKVSDLV